MTKEEFFQQTTVLLNNREFEKIKTLHAQYVDENRLMLIQNSDFVSPNSRVLNLDKAIVDLIEKNNYPRHLSEELIIKDKSRQDIFSFLAQHIRFSPELSNDIVQSCINNRRDDYLQLFVQACDNSAQSFNFQIPNLVALACFSHKDSYHVLKNYFHQHQHMLRMDSFVVAGESLGQKVDESLYIDLYYAEKKRSKTLNLEQLTEFSVSMKTNIARFFQQQLKQHQSLDGWEALQDFFMHCEEMTDISPFGGHYTLLAQVLELRQNNPVVFAPIATQMMLELMNEDKDFFNYIDFIIQHDDKTFINLATLNKKLNHQLIKSANDDDNNLKNKL
jgi:hypothetical protein